MLWKAVLRVGTQRSDGDPAASTSPVHISKSSRIAHSDTLNVGEDDCGREWKRPGWPYTAAPGTGDELPKLQSGFRETTRRRDLQRRGVHHNASAGRALDQSGRHAAEKPHVGNRTA